MSDELKDPVYIVSAETFKEMVAIIGKLPAENVYGTLKKIDGIRPVERPVAPKKKAARSLAKSKGKKSKKKAAPKKTEKPQLREVSGG